MSAMTCDLYEIEWEPRWHGFAKVTQDYRGPNGATFTVDCGWRWRGWKAQYREALLHRSLSVSLRAHQ